MGLNELKVGNSGIITNMYIDGLAISKLVTMGLILGAEVKVLSRAGKSIEISVEDSRMAISNDLAVKIMVV